MTGADRPDRSRPGARPLDVRRHNLALVMEHAAARRSVSRSEIARLTGLTKGTVSALVGELLAQGLLIERGPRAAGQIGRPRSELTLNGDGLCGVGLEIGVDYLAVCVADLLQRVRYERIEVVDNRGVPPGRVLERARRLVETALAAAGREGLAAQAIGVALPGMLRSPEGRLLVAPNLGWEDVPVLDELNARLGGSGLPVMAENEANLAALAELWLGEGRGAGDYVYVSAEIGIGAGLVLGGALFRGARGFAGEIGHVVVDPAGPRCSCGGRGCLERVAGQEAILAAAGLPTTAATSVGHADSPVPGLVARLERGDERATAAVRTAGKALGLALAGAINLLDPDSVILGGIYAPLAPWLAGTVEEGLAAQVIASGSRPVAVRASTLGASAAVRGAAASVVRRVLASPGVPIAA